MTSKIQTSSLPLSTNLTLDNPDSSVFSDGDGFHRNTTGLDTYGAGWAVERRRAQASRAS